MDEIVLQEAVEILLSRTKKINVELIVRPVLARLSGKKSLIPKKVKAILNVEDERCIMVKY